MIYNIFFVQFLLYLCFLIYMDNQTLIDSNCVNPSIGLPSVIVLLPCFRSEWGLPLCLDNLNKIKHLFSDFRILAFCDFSGDKTLEILKKYVEDIDYNIEIEVVINDKPKRQSKTDSICDARNYILEIVREKYKSYEYFIFMDTNEYACVGEIVPNTLEGVLKRKDEWDSISFDREGGYYDDWALSFDPFIYSFFHVLPWQKTVEMMREEKNKMLKDYKTNKPHEYIPVYSAFNGFAIYKMNKFINCTYDNNIHIDLFPKEILDKQLKVTGNKLAGRTNEDCEHRKFFLEAIKNNDAKIRICVQTLFKKYCGNKLGYNGHRGFQYKIM